MAGAPVNAAWSAPLNIEQPGDRFGDGDTCDLRKTDREDTGGNHQHAEHGTDHVVVWTRVVIELAISAPFVNSNRSVFPFPVRPSSLCWSHRRVDDVLRHEPDLQLVGAESRR